MIRFLGNDDIEKAIFLWNEAFGDDREFISSFLNKIGFDKVLGYFDDEHLVAMFCLIDARLKTEQGDYNSWYLYAACTANEYRKKGIMKRLIDYAKVLAKNSGISFIALVPANEKLFSYYEKSGFEKFFYRKILDEETKFESEKPFLNLMDLEEYAYSLSDSEYVRHSYPVGTVGEGKIQCNGMIYSTNENAKNIIDGKVGFFRNIMA